MVPGEKIDRLIAAAAQLTDLYQSVPHRKIGNGKELSDPDADYRYACIHRPKADTDSGRKRTVIPA